jgi:hypothetical protein
MLPYRGEVLVGTGSRLRPTDIVARTAIPGEMCLLNVAKALSLDGSDLSPYVRVTIGDDVQEGDVLAGGSGASRLFGRTYRSPVTGIVTGISHGRILIQSTRSMFELPALYRGTVINVMSGLGAIIEVKGALIQGIWGSDKEGFGVLNLMVDEPDEPLDESRIDMSCRGTILVGASCADEGLLYRAQEVEVQGMILGGLQARLAELAGSMDYAVVVTEGMGDFAISDPLFDLLKAYQGQEASIRGTMEARGGSVRPEVIIYASYAGGDAELEARPEFLLEHGSLARIVRGPHMGKTGVVAKFPSRARIPYGGGMTVGAEIRLDDGNEVFVAGANVEALG